MSLVEFNKLFFSSSGILLASNILTIAFALIFGWSVSTLLWGYWLQSVIIGVFTVPKILLASVPPKPKQVLVMRMGGSGAAKLSLANLQEKQQPVVSKGAQAFVKVFLAFFFCFHYGGFHLVYAVFLFLFSYGAQFFGQPDWAGVALIGAIFFANHLFSLAYTYFKGGKLITADIQHVFISPYARIVPMHLTLMAAVFFVFFLPFAEKAVLVLFLLLKTAADLISHKMLHRNE